MGWGAVSWLSSQLHPDEYSAPTQSIRGRRSSNRLPLRRDETPRTPKGPNCPSNAYFEGPEEGQTGEGSASFANRSLSPPVCLLHCYKQCRFGFNKGEDSTKTSRLWLKSTVTFVTVPRNLRATIFPFLFSLFPLCFFYFFQKCFFFVLPVYFIFLFIFCFFAAKTRLPTQSAVDPRGRCRQKSI